MKNKIAFIFLVIAENYFCIAVEEPQWVKDMLNIESANGIQSLKAPIISPKSSESYGRGRSVQVNKSPEGNAKDFNKGPKNIPKEISIEESVEYELGSSERFESTPIPNKPKITTKSKMHGRLAAKNAKGSNKGGKKPAKGTPKKPVKGTPKKPVKGTPNKESFEFQMGSPERFESTKKPSNSQEVAFEFEMGSPERFESTTIQNKKPKTTTKSKKNGRLAEMSEPTENKEEAIEQNSDDMKKSKYQHSGKKTRKIKYHEPAPVNPLLQVQTVNMMVRRNNQQQVIANAYRRLEELNEKNQKLFSESIR